MKRNNKLLISVLSFSLLATLFSVQTVKVVKDETNLVVTDVNENAFGRLNVGRNNVQLGTGAEVNCSETYVQYGKDSSGKNMLRFATAVKGSIANLTYTLNVGEEALRTLEVSSVYQAIQSNGEEVYYNGTSFTTDATYASEYYWACMVVRYSNADKKAVDLTAKLFVDKGADPVSTKTATLVGVMDGPTLEVANAVEGVLQGTSLTLPTVTLAQAADGTDLSSQVTITDLTEPTLDVSNGTLTSNVYGTHTIKYSVTDPFTGKENSVTRDVEVYRQLTRIQPNAGSEYISDTKIVQNTTATNQSLYFTNPGEVVLDLNMPHGTIYYAEATFDKGAESNDWRGFAHTTEVNYPFVSDGSSRWLVSTLRPNDASSIFLDSVSWKTERDRYHNQIDKMMGVTVEREGSNKVAVARDGGLFYLFINDQYVGAYNNDYYENVATCPSLFTNAYSNNIVAANITASNIDFYNDATKVRNKINTLLGNGTIMRQYCPYDWAPYDTTGTRFEFGYNETDGNYVDVKNPDAGNGNANLWSPWIWLGGDFTFEFDYTFNSTTASGQSGRMRLELRGWDYSTPIVEFGAKYSMDDPQFMMDQEQYYNEQLNGKDNVVTDGFNKYNQPTMSSKGVTKTDKLHYKISRQLVAATGDGTGVNKAHSVITMSIWKNGTKLVSQTVKVYETTAASEEILICMQNAQVTGKYTNITWNYTYSAD